MTKKYIVRTKFPTVDSSALKKKNAPWASTPKMYLKSMGILLIVNKPLLCMGSIKGIYKI